MNRYVFVWLSSAALVTLVCGLSYAIVQQEYRESLNDPQIQLAEDTALAVQNGAGIENALFSGGRPLEVSTSSPGHVDLAQSLSPWVAYYGADGTPVDSTGLLDGNLPRLPKGVFDAGTWLKHQNGTYYDQGPVLETRFTWQPEPGVRQAVVLVKLADDSRGVAYVASGRNMREVEQRIEHEGEMVFVGWLVIMAVLSALQLAYVFFVRGAAGRR